MTPEDVPFAETFARAGSEDPVFGALLVLGPVLVVVIAVLGRTEVTVALAAGYVGFLVAYIPYKSLRNRRNQSARSVRRS